MSSPLSLRLVSYYFSLATNLKPARRKKWFVGHSHSYSGCTSYVVEVPDDEPPRKPHSDLRKRMAYDAGRTGIQGSFISRLFGTTEIAWFRMACPIRSGTCCSHRTRRRLRRFVLSYPRRTTTYFVAHHDLTGNGWKGRALI